MKKILAIALSAMLLLALLPFPAAAAGDNCIIGLTDCEAVPGGTVQMQISIQNNPGICALIIRLDLPDGFSVESVTNGRLLDSLTVGPNLVWDDDEPTESDGVLATVTLRVDENVEPDEYDAGLTVREVCDENAHIDPSAFETGIGCITVRDTLIRDLKTVSGVVNFKVDTCRDGNLFAVAAVYGTNGQMLSCTAKKVTRTMFTSGTYMPVSVPDGAHAVLYLMDGSTYEPVTEKTPL